MTQLLDHASAAADDDRALRADLVERARALVPLLAENAARAEADRRIPEESVEALRDAGLFKLMVPKRYGGFEVDFRTKLEVSAALAEGCGSTAWVAALTNVCAWLAGLFPERTQDEVFGADPDARIAGVLAPTATSRRVDGGLVVTGRWAWSSGSLHATWGGVGVPVVDESGEVVDQGLVLIPMSELAIEDTWFVAGMKGTGSNTLVAEEVFVPDHRVMSLGRAIGGDYPTEHKEEALYRSAFVPVLALVLVGPQLGLGRAALRLAIDKAPKKAVSYTVFEKQTDSAAFHIKIAEAALKVDTAHLHAFRAAADIDDAAARGEYLDVVTRARVRADTGLVAETVTAAIDTLLTAHGGSSFADASAMQRIWRDSNVAARHAVVNPMVGEELYGKVLLGVEENITVLI